ncbi:GNAT family N-acetyltransferase [Natrialbaceae archaeon AArc-T1-2]|uniref:GNAT family N-acetyltransferase n=1 Tax=Natrialbaceae archaeon AArc-T1-2 TaxID=3053904 RepID=UPI00255B15C1|nr:GNAT family protein [Natrialbaceae archaeon AArc-T1-2]WIV65786.1 GNAT family protein [Natrialbaceae archaeon AArc-T1-2]
MVLERRRIGRTAPETASRESGPGFPERLTTDRLLLERACCENVDPLQFHRIRSSDGIDDVVEYLPWEPDETPRETADVLARFEREWTEGSVARYVVRPRTTEPDAGELAGVTKLEVDRERSVGTLGIWLRRRFWGRGYSGERAGALLSLAFDRLDLEIVEVVHQDGNERSRRAVERYIEAYGGEYVGRLRNWRVDGDEVVDAHRYVITADEYAAGPK